MTVPDLTVGDSEKPWLDVAPYQLGDTAAALTLHSPTDTDPTGTSIPLDGGVETVVDGLPVLRFTAVGLTTYPAAGWWVRSWTVTGVGACQPDERFFVAPNPTAGGPLWTPTRERVASYVPSRPLVPTADGSNKDLMTFDATTRPTGAQVDLLIAAAVNWVLSATGDLDATLTETATDCAALRAAGFVELGYPERDDPTKSTANQTSDRLFKQAEQMLRQLVARNESLTGVNPDESGAVFEVAPAYRCTPPALSGVWLL